MSKSGESPKETGDILPDSDANTKQVECLACRELIAAGTSICPFCKTRQSLLSIRTQTVRWTAAVLTLVTLVLGLREGIDLVATHIERRTVVNKYLDAAANLSAAREYITAWDLTEEVAKVAPQNPRLQRDRLAIARVWLLDAHTLGSERGFLDIVDRVVPFLSALAPEMSQRRRAEIFALLAFAERLRERSEVVSLDVPRLYRLAIDTDPNCGLAHLLLGHDLALWGNLTDALPELALAAERTVVGDLDPALFRRYQFSALSANFHRYSKETDRLVAVELMRAVNDVRKRGETLPIDPQRLSFGESSLWDDLENIHSEAAIDSEDASYLARALPPAEHLATLVWIKDNRPPQLRIDGILIWIAMILEQQQDTEAAVATLQSIPAKGLSYRLEPLVDQALIRLTGQSHRSLEDRDPWAWRSKMLSDRQPGSSDFDRALVQVSTAVNNYHMGVQSNRDQLLAALKAADNSFRQKLKSGTTLSESSFETWLKLRFNLGIVLKDKGMLPEALSVLSKLNDELKPGHVLRGDVLVEMAAVHAQLASSDQKPPGPEVKTGITLLAQAVETEGYVDWARLRWLSDLAPLRDTLEFTALLARHGRSPSPAKTEVQHAN